MDLLAEDTDVELPARSVLAPTGPATSLDAAADLLAAATRPAIVAGDGVGREDAVAELVAIAESLGADVFHQPMHDGIDFPGRHPLHAGALPPVNSAINKALTGYDAVFVVGCHAFMPHHYSPGPAIPHTARIVQLDSDPGEPGRNFAVSLGLVGGIKLSLAALAPLIAARVSTEDHTVEPRHESRWTDANSRALAAYGPAPFDPLAAVHAIVAGLPEDAVIVEEAITSGLLFRSVWPMDRPGSLVHTVGGGLGMGIGAAIGTHMGDPTRPVVAVLGDGCAMFGLQGLWSAARYRIPVTFVIMNNGEYKTLKDTMDREGSRASEVGTYPGLDLSPTRLDYTRAADFFGVPAFRPTDLASLTEAIAKSTTSGTPLLVDVPITGHPSH
ncbi:thiamine pyrophosphate-dependent enzyme [Actinokineospora enzanensis]|uniref:thiamine pyrophosphate-dependent enzyme n=1 Tax=Actinokineospora enzanensis TaxID=155975 RepID=UPI00316AD21B